MAPGKKRVGGKGAKAKSQLNLGDLVLAKVKGFPAWPAKISKPEDWERAPDPKKYFVQFFGTEEIAFVAPVDIQPFTSESKNKLLARCKGKTVKYFSQAVREICNIFEEFQNKSSDSLKDGNDGHSQPDANSTEMVDDGMTTDGPCEETSFHDVVNHGSGLERCSHIDKEMEYEDVKPSASPIVDDHSPLAVSSQKQSGLCNDAVTSPKEESISTSGAGHNKKSKSGIKVETNGQKSKKIARASKKNPDGDHGISKIYSPADFSSLVQTSHPESTVTENSKDGIRRSFLHGIKNEVTEGVVKPEFGGHLKKAKTLLKDTPVRAADDLSKNVEGDSKEQNCVELTERKLKSEHGLGKDNVLNNGVLHPMGRAKCLDDVPNRPQTYRKNDVSVKGGNEEVKKLTSSLKIKNRLVAKGQTNVIDSGGGGDEDVIPPSKRRRLALEGMSGSTKMSEDRISKSYIPSKKGDNTNAIQSNTQGPLKRRAVRICDDEDEPKTPVHGGSTKVADGVSHIKVSVDEGATATEAIKDSSGLRNSIVHVKKVLLSSEQFPLSSSPNSCQNIVQIVERQFSHSPGKAESEKKTCEEVFKVLVSPTKSPVMVDSYNPMVESLKANKSLGNVSGNVSQKKGQSGSLKASSGNYDGLHRSQNNAVNERSRTAISGEKQKSTPKSSSRATDSSAALRKSSDKNLLSSERLEFVRVDQTILSAEQKSADLNKSMKHLIAVAQAKRKQAQAQILVHDSLNISHVTTSEAIVRSPGSISATQPILAGPEIMVQTDGHGYRSQTSHASPSRVHQFISNDQPDPAEFEETGISSGHRSAGDSLSGGTEAAVARDAFEGMIETLSRTKESIGRATRHAIDCAKHGIANEVVELLIQKLESESSFHRRVDLFFLVDSITQCSHSQKGIAGASYIPTVQAALPRLLGAAAPPGPNARENRRQCLKVLKLWLERKILPGTLLRSYIEDIGASNDDASGGLFSKRPSRSERAVDDPIREMEGMLVDEYGSNATFQMPGFLSSNVFEEEEDDILNFSHKEGLGKSTFDVNPATGGLETCSVTPNDKRHCILEDVDFELEMEDVSGHPKDEKFFIVGCSKVLEQEESSDRIMESASNNSNEVSPFREGSPPLPLDSPPPTPPLPSSPPPPLSPMVPPPPSSPSPPPPPPPPPQPPSQTYPIHPPILGPSEVSFPQTSLLSQSSLPPQSSMPPQTSTAQHAYQSPMPSIVPFNPRLGAHVDAAVRGEMFPQQPSSFVSAVVSSSREPSGYNSLRTVEYGHETYTNSQGSQPNQQFQTANVPLPPRAFQPPMRPQTGAGQFQYPNHAMHQHPYPPLYGLTKNADGPRRYGADEQWRPPSNEFSTDNQRGVWISNSRPPLSSGPPFAQEGYFRMMERPPANNVGIQPTGQNKIPAGASIPGHSGSMMLPCRPDMSSLNSWRPA